MLRLLTICAALSALALTALAPAASAATPDYPAASTYTQGIHYSWRSSRTIKYIVIHTIEGSAAGAISWFKHPSSKVSAHYIVSYGGTVTQMIREKDKAWHAGNSYYNEHSIGIENEGYAGKNNWTTAQYKSLAKLTAYLCKKYSVPVDRDHLIAHKEVPGSTHWDPGPHFDWDYFLHLVRAYKGGSTTTTPPTTTTSPTSSVKARKITASKLNVRTSAWGSILGQTSYGKIHCRSSVSGDWAKMHWAGRSAYYWNSYSTSSSAYRVKVTASALNVRSTAYVASWNKLGTVYKGQYYREITRSGSWVKIQFDHRSAWVHGSYVTRLP